MWNPILQSSFICILFVPIDVCVVLFNFDKLTFLWSANNRNTTPAQSIQIVVLVDRSLVSWKILLLNKFALTTSIYFFDQQMMRYSWGYSRLFINSNICTDSSVKCTIGNVNPMTFHITMFYMYNYKHKRDVKQWRLIGLNEWKLICTLTMPNPFKLFNEIHCNQTKAWHYPAGHRSPVVPSVGVADEARPAQ